MQKRNSKFKKMLLIILDGFGEGKPYKGNAVTLAKTPYLDMLKKKYPWSLLKASGNAVGIPEGTQGNSEVGHFTMGAGRLILQSLEEINRSIQNGSFFKKPALVEAYRRVKKRKASALHLLGMISDQGVHSDIRHLFALLELAKREKVEETFIHAITDGRDVPERSAIAFIKAIQKKIKELGMEKRIFIATIVGRYYAMDRDSNWNRTKKAYELYTLGKGVKEKNPIQAIQNAYSRGIPTDYYINPILLDEHGVIKNKDSVIFWNFRTDRSRQITSLFTRKKKRPYFVCLGPYSDKAPVVFPAPIVKNNLGEVISKTGLKQFRIAETEKYAHITYFFNSQVEKPFRGEDRLLVNSLKCPSYAQKPEMSARKITNALLPQLNTQKYHLIVLNFANCDLVGHSGNLPSAIKAVEVIDECLSRIIPNALKNNYTTLVTADHGNIEYMIYEKNGAPCPSHTANPVPFIIVGAQKLKVRNGGLKDIAPTILKIMELKKPSEMNGNSLLQ